MPRAANGTIAVVPAVQLTRCQGVLRVGETRCPPLGAFNTIIGFSRAAAVLAVWAGITGQEGEPGWRTHRGQPMLRLLVCPVEAEREMCRVRIGECEWRGVGLNRKPIRKVGSGFHHVVAAR
jgi:hypothetical protein